MIAEDDTINSRFTLSVCSLSSASGQHAVQSWCTSHAGCAVRCQSPLLLVAMCRSCCQMSADEGLNLLAMLLDCCGRAAATAVRLSNAEAAGCLTARQCGL